MFLGASILRLNVTYMYVELVRMLSHSNGWVAPSAVQLLRKQAFPRNRTQYDDEEPPAVWEKDFGWGPEENIKVRITASLFLVPCDAAVSSACMCGIQYSSVKES
jgi:hypothetical protein